MSRKNFDGINPQNNLSFAENERAIAQRRAQRDPFTGGNNTTPFITRTVTLRIDNRDYDDGQGNITPSNDLDICLFPGILEDVKEARDVAGDTFDVLLGDGRGLPAGLTVKSSVNWNFFKKWLVESPSLLNEIQMRSTDTTQLGNPISLYNLTPFGRGEKVTFVPDSVQSQRDSNVHMVNIDTKGLQLDAFKAMSLFVNKNTTVNFTFFIGTSASTAYDLAKSYSL